MGKLRGILLMGFILLTVLFSGCTGQAVESNSVPPEESETAAETEPSAPQISFQGTDLEGNVVTSDIFSQSKLTMINVWATSCNPCLSEMPGLGQLAAEYAPEEFQLIGVVSDVMEGEDQTLVESLVRQTGADYPHLLLNESIYYAFLTNVSGVPTTFFLDEDGHPLGYVLGAREKSAWEELINALLEEL